MTDQTAIETVTPVITAANFASTKATDPGAVKALLDAIKVDNPTPEQPADELPPPPAGTALDPKTAGTIKLIADSAPNHATLIARETLASMTVRADRLDAEIKAIAADTKYSTEYKATEIDKRKAELAAQQLAASQIITQLDTMAAELQAGQRLSFVPPVADVPTMLYTRDVLLGLWEDMTENEIAADWQTALSAGDLITARVYRDHATTHLKRIAKAIAERQGNADTPGGKPRSVVALSMPIRALMDATNAALSTPEQKGNLKTLAEAQAVKAQARKVASKVYLLSQTKLDRQGKLIDGAQSLIKPMSY